MDLLRRFVNFESEMATVLLTLRSQNSSPTKVKAELSLRLSRVSSAGNYFLYFARFILGTVGCPVLKVNWNTSKPSS